MVFLVIFAIFFFFVDSATSKWSSWPGIAGLFILVIRQLDSQSYIQITFGLRTNDLSKLQWMVTNYLFFDIHTR